MNNTVKNIGLALSTAALTTQNLIAPASAGTDGLAANKQNINRDERKNLVALSNPTRNPVNYTLTSHSKSMIQQFFSKVEQNLFDYSPQLFQTYQSSKQFQQEISNFLSKIDQTQDGQIIYQELANYPDTMLNFNEKELAKVLRENWSYVDPSLPHNYPEYPSNCNVNQLNANRNNPQRPLVLILDGPIDHDPRYPAGHFQINSIDTAVQPYEQVFSHASAHARVLQNKIPCVETDYADKAIYLPENKNLNSRQRKLAILNYIDQAVKANPGRQITVSVSRIEEAAMIPIPNLPRISPGANLRNYREMPHAANIQKYVQSQSPAAFEDIKLMEAILNNYPQVNIVMAVGNNGLANAYGTVNAGQTGQNRMVLACSIDEQGNDKPYTAAVRESCDAASEDKLSIQAIPTSTGQVGVDYNRDNIPEGIIPAQDFQRIPLGKNPQSILMSNDLFQDLQIINRDFFPQDAKYENLLRKYGARNREELFQNLVRASHGQVMSAGQRARLFSSTSNNNNIRNNRFYELTGITMGNVGGIIDTHFKTYEVDYRGLLGLIFEGSSFAK